MTIAILVLSVLCLGILLITGFTIDTNHPDDVETLGLVVTFMVMPMLLAMCILGIIQVAS